MRHLLFLLVVLVAGSTAAAQLSGTFTINPLAPGGGTNFTSLASAVSALTSLGVSGPVTFEIFDDAGPYTETAPFTTANVVYTPSTAVLVLGTWAGASSTNRVTFRAGPGESPVFDATSQGMGVFWNGADYVTLEGIEIRNAPFDAVSFYSEASHGQVFDAVVRRCRIHDCGGGGVIIYGNSARPQNTVVENNFFWNLQTTNAGGFNTLARFGYVSGRRHDNSRVINNTFYVNAAAGSAFAVIGDMASGGTMSHFAEVSNNIIVKTVNGTAPIYNFPAIGTSGIPAIVDANCYHDTSGGPFAAGMVTASTFSAWQMGSGKDANSLAADPMLVNPAAGDLHLQPGSPCINLSTVPSGVMDDIDGEPRAGNPDVGADELTICTPAEFETNSPESSLTLDGVQGTTCTAAVTMKQQGASASITFASTNVGQGWEAGIAVAALVPRSSGGLVTGSGQILNLDLSAPQILFVNGGTFPNFGNPFPGSFSLLFTAPNQTLTASAQMVNVDQTNPDGIAISQGVQLVVP